MSCTKNKGLFTLFFFLFVIHNISAQNRDNWKGTPPIFENFEKIIAMGHPSEEQFDTIWNVTVQYCNNNRDTCTLLADHIVRITKDIDNRKLYGAALYLQAWSVLDQNKEKGLNILYSSRDILKKEEAAIYLSYVEALLGKTYATEKKFQKAMEHMLEAVTLVKTTPDTFEYIEPLTAVGGIYYRMGNLQKAQEYLTESVKMLEATGAEEKLPPILGNQAMIYQNQGIKYMDRFNEEDSASKIYQDSAMLFFQQGIEAAEKGISIAKKINNPANILGNLNILSSLKNNTKEYKEAVKICQESLPMAEEIGILFFIINNKKNLCKAQRNLGLLKEALVHAEQGYEMSKDASHIVNPVYFENEQYKIHKALGNPSKALSFIEKVLKNQRDLNETKVQNAVADAETKYQTTEKERQILEQEKDILELEVTNSKIARQRNLIMGGGTLLGLLGLFGYRYNKIQKDRNDKKEFAEALIFAQEEERKRIARDLHDGIGQSLLLIKKQLDTNTNVTLENQKMISDTLEEVRSISRDLHPIQLEKFGLTATINDSIEKVERSTNLFISKEIADIDNCLSPKSEIHLFRTIQEALSNIVKHAEATAAKISIENNADHLHVTIQDNGKGFDLEMAVVASKSLGIKTMHERISAIGGQLKISKGENNGMRVEMTIPKT